MAMNPEIKARWVAALRSGKYEQAKRVLRSKNDGMCCLGVLCDLAGKAGLASWGRDTMGDWLFTEDGYATLPHIVSEWAGLSTYNGAEVFIGDEKAWLPTHNDKGRTFAEIADAIEAQL